LAAVIPWEEQKGREEEEKKKQKLDLHEVRTQGEAIKGARKGERKGSERLKGREGKVPCTSTKKSRADSSTTPAPS
jgi:hypothetical protein